MQQCLHVLPCNIGSMLALVLCYFPGRLPFSGAAGNPCDMFFDSEGALRLDELERHFCQALEFTAVQRV